MPDQPALSHPPEPRYNKATESNELSELLSAMDIEYPDIEPLYNAATMELTEEPAES